MMNIIAEAVRGSMRTQRGMPGRPDVVLGRKRDSLVERGGCLCVTHVNMQYGRWKDEVEVVSVEEGEVLQVLRTPSMCLSITVVNNAGQHCPYH